MPRDTSPGRPGTPLFPDAWEGFHRPAAALQFTASCAITLPPPSAAATFDEVSGRSVYPAATVLYTGGCRVQVESRPVPVDAVGGRAVSRSLYRVSIAAGVTGVAVGALVAVTAAPHDPVLPARLLWVIELPTGSLTWQTELICVDEAPITR